MQQQVIQSFLNLPGIVGLALMDGRSQPYFFGLEAGLNYQQRQALIQGIQQVVGTTPPEFESFSFEFSQHNVHIYRLVEEAILLVLTEPIIDAPRYRQGIRELRQALATDPHNLVTNFRMAAGGATLNNQPYWSPIATEETTPTAPAPPPASSAPQWQDVLTALNALSDGTAPYLGKIVVANTWRSTRGVAPSLSWLHLDRSGHFTLGEDSDLTPTAPFAPADQVALQAWVTAFVKRCSGILRDYPITVLATALSAEQQTLIYKEP